MHLKPTSQQAEMVKIEISKWVLIGFILMAIGLGYIYGSIISPRQVIQQSYDFIEEHCICYEVKPNIDTNIFGGYNGGEEYIKNK